MIGDLVHEPEAGSVTTEAVEGLGRAEALYERGLYVQSLGALGGSVPPERLTGPSAMVFASRLIGNLGGDRLSSATALRAWRMHPGEPAVYPMALLSTLRVRGLLEALELAERRPVSGTADERADGLIAEAQVLSQVRDFAGAHALLDEAALAGSQHHWCAVTRAIVCSDEDRYGESRSLLEGVLSRRPDYRPAVQHLAHLLVLDNRPRDAVALLEAAADRLESGSVLVQLAIIHGDAESWEDSLGAIDRAASLMPYMDRSERQRLSALRSDAMYGLGRMSEALACAREAGALGGFYSLVASSMESASSGARRVLLPVPFVRQHHNTCAPATMSAIGRFFDRPCHHLEVAEEICYDGTPNHSERSWAERSGWRSVEFTVTPEATRALLDAGFPFTLSTVFPTHAHLQAVVGYDDRRSTMIIRDPTYPRYGEMHFDSLGLFASFGPRGHVFVPPELAGALGDLELPDARLYEVHHRLNSALDSNRREEAVGCAADLRDLAPDHRLVHMGQLAIAAYDRDDRRALRALDGLGSLFPSDPLVVTMRASRLRSLGRRAEAIDLLDRHAGDTLEGDRLTLARPTLRRQLASALSDDAREHDRAVRMLRRSARNGANVDRVMIDLARIASVREDTDEEIRLLRVALCLELTDEWVAGRFFWACRAAGRAEEGLRFLRDRFESLGDRSAHPAISLHRALSVAGQEAEARTVLDAAVRRRPDDADLLLFCAEAMVLRGEYDGAASLLDEVPEGRESFGLPLRASIAQRRGDLAEARRCIGTAIQRTPLDASLHHRYAGLIGDIEGPESGRRYLRTLFDQRPHSDGLASVLVEQLSEHDHDGIIAIAQRVVEANPASGWGWRELALQHAHLGRFEQADRFMREAEALDPSDSATLLSRASIERDSGDLDASLLAYRAAFERDPTDPGVLAALVRLRPDARWIEEQLEWAWGVIVRSPVIEESVTAWGLLAVQSMDGGSVVARLERFASERPLVRHGWFALVAALTSTGSLDRAKSVAVEACDRFAWSAEPWYRRSRVHYYRAELREERDCIERALAVEPAHVPSIRWQIEDARANGHADAALTHVENALALVPGDPDLLGTKAELLLRSDDVAGALALIARLLERWPDHADAWATLKTVAALGPEEHGRVVEMLTALCVRVPGSAILRVRLAELLPEEASARRLGLLDEAMERNPRTIEAYEVLASVRLSVGDESGAIESCVGSRTVRAFGGAVPPGLRRLAVRIKAHCGRLSEACTELRASLDENPHDVDGWITLCDWLSVLGRQEDADSAAMRVGEIAPHEPRALVYAGDATRASDPGRALGLYQRVVAIEPSYDYAHGAIAQLHIEGGRPEEAREAIRDRLGKTEYSLLPVLEARLAMGAGDQSGLVRAVRLLARLPDARVAFCDLLEEIENRDGRVVCSALHASIESGEASPGAAYVWSWIDYWSSGLAKNQQTVHRRLKSNPDALAIEMMNAHLDRLASKTLLEVHPVTKKWRKWIDRDTESWARAGYRMAERHAPRAAWRWVSGWRDREDLSTLALSNVMSVATAARRIDEAVAAGTLAADLPYSDGSDFAAIWQALLLIGRGDAEPLRAVVSRLGDEPLDAFDRFLLESAAVVLGVVGADRGARATAARTLKQSLRSSPFRRRPGVRWLLRGAVRGAP